MNENRTARNTSGTSKLIFVLSIIVSAYWWLGKVINVYRFAFAGAIYEILWLPALALLFILPVISVIFLVKEKISIKSLFLYSVLISAITILFMVFSK